MFIAQYPFRSPFNLCSPTLFSGERSESALAAFSSASRWNATSGFKPANDDRPLVTNGWQDREAF